MPEFKLIEKLIDKETMELLLSGDILSFTKGAAALQMTLKAGKGDNLTPEQK